MNKFTENECLPNFEFKFKFLENLMKLLTLKSTQKRIEEKTKQQRRGKKAKRQTGINSEKGQVSIPENQTIEAYTDDELPCFRGSMVSKNTKKSTSARHLQSWFKEKHGKRMNLYAVSKQEAPQLLKHFFLETRRLIAICVGCVSLYVILFAKTRQKR